MKSAFVTTRWIAASTSAAMAACWAFRSTNGSFWVTSPDVWTLVKAFEADQLGDGLDALGRTSRDHRACLHVFGHDAAGPDQRPRADLESRQYGRVGADADVVLDGRSQHALQVARTHRMRIVGEDHVRREEHALAQRCVLEKASAVDARPA